MLVLELRLMLVSITANTQNNFFFFNYTVNKTNLYRKKTLKKFFTKLFYITANRYKFQIKDKRSLLILNVQNIDFNVVKICVFEIFLNALNQAYHISNSNSNMQSFLCPIFLGIFPPLSLYLGGITR